MDRIAKHTRIIFVICFLSIYLITFFSGIESPMLRTVFSITLAFVISPRRKKIKTQTGEKTQVTWVFLKEPITIE